jgi:hypothetical protein
MNTLRRALLALLLTVGLVTEVVFADSAVEGTKDGVNRKAIALYDGVLEDFTVALNGSIYAAL